MHFIGELARSPQEACYTMFTGSGNPEFVTLVGKFILYYEIHKK